METQKLGDFAVTVTQKECVLCYLLEHIFLFLHVLELTHSIDMHNIAIKTSISPPHGCLAIFSSTDVVYIFFCHTFSCNMKLNLVLYQIVRNFRLPISLSSCCIMCVDVRCGRWSSELPCFMARIILLRIACLPFLFCLVQNFQSCLGDGENLHKAFFMCL